MTNPKDDTDRELEGGYLELDSPTNILLWALSTYGVQKEARLAEQAYNPPTLVDTKPFVEGAVEKLQALIEREKIEARIEAYEHIAVSDNGMKEPLRSWLRNYIASLRAQSQDSASRKQKIDKAVERVVDEYGETLEMLGSDKGGEDGTTN